MGDAVERLVSSYDFAPATLPSLQLMVFTVRDEAVSYGSLGNVPSDMQAKSATRCT